MVKLYTTKQSWYVLVFIGDFLVRKSRQKTQNKTTSPNNLWGGVFLWVFADGLFITKSNFIGVIMKYFL